jgi:RND family efflux transporter MFP subunit
MWLAQLDDTQIQVAFLSARSALSAAEVEAASAEREEERAAALAAAGAISDRDLDQAKRMNTVAKAQLADAKSRLALAQKQVDATRILAPFAGVISERTVTAGDLVQPGNALFTVIDPSSMRLEASLPAQELSEVKVGSRVSFSVSGYSGGGFSGRITRISPAADRVTGQIRILASIPNPGRTLVSGLFAEGRVATHSESALLVPVAAVDLTGLVPSVTRMKDGRAQKVDVQTGLRDAATEMIQIVSGVAAGDTLLLGAAQGLPSGAPVRMSPRGDVGAPVSSTPGGYQE